MRCQNRTTLLVIILIILLAQQVVRAQEAVVYGVFFYSPSCPHCQQVIQNDWPTMQAEFGDQLDVLFINASTAQGSGIMTAARSALQIESSGVPMLIIGSDVFVGSFDIPARAPGVIRAGLAAGGISLPAIPNIDAIYAEAVAQSEQTGAEIPHAETPDSEIITEAEAISSATLSERLAADPIANGLAVVILALLIVSLFFAVPRVRSTSALSPMVEKLYRAALFLTPLVGIGISLSLLAGSDGQPLVLAIAAAEVIIFTVLLLTSRQPSRSAPALHWRLPLTALAGLATASYLASIEVAQTEAVCGLVGNCNLVQQSPYAQIAGIPIGIIGVLGYIVVLLLWGVNRLSGGIPAVEWMLRATALVGVVFSTYLTFLEPFVIGATCLWCLTSAVIMLLLLWMLLPLSEEVVTEPRAATA